MLIIKSIAHRTAMGSVLLRVPTPRAELKSKKSLGLFRLPFQGLIGWGTLNFRTPNLHAKDEKSILSSNKF
ncbi:MAG: hypothetical protein AAFW66_14405 [Pseudomonadota bacterium]